MDSHTALRLYAEQVVLLPTEGRERALAENILELLDENERLRDLRRWQIRRLMEILRWGKVGLFRLAQQRDELLEELNRV